MITVSVMAHPNRRAAAEKLAAELDAEIAWDERDDELDTGSRAWKLGLRPDNDWHLVIQDDALPVPGLMAHLAEAVKHAPRTAISLYVGTGKPRVSAVRDAVRAADRIGASWLECWDMMWGVAVLVPAEHITGLFAAEPPAWASAYDRRIGWHYATQLQIPVRYTWPSLVDHADTPPVIDHGSPQVPRHAHRVGIPKGWDGAVVTIV